MTMSPGQAARMGAAHAIAGGRHHPAPGVIRANARLLACVVAAASLTATGVLAIDFGRRTHMPRPAIAVVQDQTVADQAIKQATVLARSTLLALQHANLTEDYAVLWRLAAPDFQKANPPARLAEIFTELRRRRLDLSIAAVTEPMWSTRPMIDGNGKLKLTGAFPARGGHLRFDLDYVPLQGLWRMTGVTVAFAPDVRTAEAERR